MKLLLIKSKDSGETELFNKTKEAMHSLIKVVKKIRENCKFEVENYKESVKKAFLQDKETQITRKSTKKLIFEAFVKNLDIEDFETVEKIRYLTLEIENDLFLANNSIIKGSYYLARAKALIFNISVFTIK